MEVVLDLSPQVLQLLDMYRGQHNRSSFLSYMIALYHDGMQPSRQVQQVQQPVYQAQQYQAQPVYDNGIGSIDSLEPVQQVRKEQPLHRANRSFNEVLAGGMPARSTRPKATVSRSKSKTVPRKTR